MIMYYYTYITRKDNSEIYRVYDQNNQLVYETNDRNEYLDYYNENIDKFKTEEYDEKDFV